MARGSGGYVKLFTHRERKTSDYNALNYDDKFVIYVTNLSSFTDVQPNTHLLILLDTESYDFRTNGTGFAAIHCRGGPVSLK